MHYNYREALQDGLSLSSDNIEAVINSLKDENKIKCGFEMQEEIELHTFVKDMDALESWCNTKGTERSTAFFLFFQDAVLGAYYRYMVVKGKAWSSKRNVIMLICFALLPALSSTVLQWISSQVSSSRSVMDSIIGIVLGIIWLGLYLYYEMNKKRAYDETWVRHSACYERLRLALSAFLTSPRNDKDFEMFVSAVFRILDQNLDQFELNLSAHGVASRETKSE